MSLLILILLLLFHLSHLQTSSSSHPDADPLLAFKTTSSDPSNSLSSWNTTTSICTSWRGVSCLPNGRVSKLVLESLNLHGPFPTPLLSLTNLHVLSLSHNYFNGSLPSNLSSLSSLKLLFLSHNSFTGSLPASISNISKLYRLDLSYNYFSGQILPSLVNPLTHLLTLRLEGNRFSGEISGLNLPNIQDFNVSGNQLAGKIPTLFSTFPVTAFSGNKALCGTPLLPCKETSTNPTKPGGDKTGGIASPVGPAVVVSSTPSTGPTKVEPPKDDENSIKKKKSTARISLWAIIVIILADVLVILLVVLLIYCYFLKKTSPAKHSSGSSLGNNGVVEKVIFSNPVNRSASGGVFERQNGKMVFFDGLKKFELEDLLRASAEMLGKGVIGTVYKAVLDDGSVVAVKRLKEVQVSGKKEFEEQMEILGRLRHDNLVGLKAYYFARDEKLLVFDYLPNASLFWLLHGNRGPGRTPLDWTTRLKIASGAGRGVAFIHNSCKALKLIHGNIKSTNILIDKDGNACVSDFGLSSFAPTPPGNPRSNGYRAPESLDGRRLTQKADVYSFGVLLLELLTGKYPSVVEGNGAYGTIGVGGVLDLPRWVQSVVREEWTAEVFDLELMRYKDIEEEMVGLLQVAMACTSASPDQRPRMSQVVRMIEDIRGVGISPSHEPIDSESPSLSEDTGAASQ